MRTWIIHKIDGSVSSVEAKCYSVDDGILYLYLDYDTTEDKAKTAAIINLANIAWVQGGPVEE